MLNGQGHSDNLSTDAASRLNHYMRVDNERQAFIHSILKRIDADAKRIAELELDLEDQKRSRAVYQSKASLLEKDVQTLDQKVNKDPFVVVLIDGDGAKFADEFLRDPAEGAERAAQKLKQAVRDNLRGTSFGHDDISIVVRVYANLSDLSKSLRLSRVISSDDEMRLFAERFTNSRADFDFVNVGKGKENADSKIRRLPDDRVVLLETTPAEPGFRSLGFPITRFDDVFRSEPLNNETKHTMLPPPGLQPMPIRVQSPLETNSEPFPRPGPIARPTLPVSKASSAISPGQQQEQRPPVNHTTVSTPSPVLSTATTDSKPPVRPQTTSVISSGNGGISVNYATAGGSNDHQNVTVKAPKPKKQPKVIYYNADGYRIDPPTQHPPRTPAQATYQAKFQSIKPSVFCNDFYLKGRCKWGVNCDKTHDAELTAPELAIHRYKARTSICPAGPYCVDYDCYLSHHCIRDPCTRDDCQFLDTKKWGDLHLTKSQLQPATRWTEGVDIPEHI
ncbi:hypothetical protein DL766_002706 [Monosporascus sp. MC13-8B]|uniref:C3H1-type domain-containing protein n=1 Tax=Monosporascus cannonballus TaxID=155416 RepID=A0ABY0HJ34_9PEZI|nr:hypothetical protein DL762_000718 [Monosporascus cannonballus]RYO98005.1 hypothetical protein DL763_002510 [Monosporascus cannonballus]RYP34992.1 hypothetical protein DL766_002706 [Monosporascus sp. MC13-8B]